MKKNATNKRKTNLTKKTNLTAERERKKCEEAFFKLVLSEEEPQDDDYWLHKAEELARDPDRAPTSEQRAAFEERLSREVKIIQNQKRIKARADRRRRRIPQIARRLAMVAVFLTIVTSATLYYTVDAFAVGVDNFISTIFPKAQELRLQEGNGSDIELNVADFEGMYVPDWVPNGFNIVDVEGESYPKMVTYANSNEEIIWYYIYNDKSSLRIDDEDTQTKVIYVHDSWGKKVIKDEEVYVIWEDGLYVYMICGDLMFENDLVKILEKSIKVSLEG